MDASYIVFLGSEGLRSRLVLSTLTRTPIEIRDIRSGKTPAGLLSYERSLLNLFQKICHGADVKYTRSGVLVFGFVSQASSTTMQAKGLWVEILLTSVMDDLLGITNGNDDFCVDTFQITTLPIFKKFGMRAVDLKIVPPQGKGEVVLTIPSLLDSVERNISTGNTLKVTTVENFLTLCTLFPCSRVILTCSVSCIMLIVYNSTNCG